MSKRYAQHSTYGRVEVLHGPIAPSTDKLERCWVLTSSGAFKTALTCNLTSSPFFECFYNVHPHGNSLAYGTLEEANKVYTTSRIAVLRRWQQDEDGPWKAELIETTGERQ